jgi:hypothetical protein
MPLIDAPRAGSLIENALTATSGFTSHAQDRGFASKASQPADRRARRPPGRFFEGLAIRSVLVTSIHQPGEEEGRAAE